MLVNSSNNSITPPGPFLLSTNSLSIYCFISSKSNIIVGFFIVYNAITLPLCILILYYGLHEWKQKYFNSSGASVSSSDCFTYHTVVMALIGGFGCILCIGGIYRNQLDTLRVGILLWYFSWYGETFFHTLSCLERYMAIVHPITYLNLKSQRGIQIRNIITGCIWLICIAGLATLISEIVFIILNFSLMVLVLTVISFCSLSVLNVLIRPSPGKQQGERQRVDQSKERAFYTIVAILGVLLLRFIGSLVWTVANRLQDNHDCLIVAIVSWCTLPSSLVQPLLFLHRSGKLVSLKTIFK